MQSQPQSPSNQPQQPQQPQPQKKEVKQSPPNFGDIGCHINGFLVF